QRLSARVYLHGNGLVHREIKPPNILIGPNERLVIVDFGLAKAIDSTFQQTATGGVVGTPHFMSPEQINSAPVGAGSDLYSFGVVLFLLVTGRLPFAGRGLQLLTDRSTQRAPPISDYRSDLPIELSTLVDSLLALDPSARPTARACADVLRRLLPVAPPSRGALPGGESPWHGRTEHIGKLQALLSPEDDVSLVRISGESGIGKTRLVQETLRQLRRNSPDLLVFRGRCHPEASVPFKAFDPLIDGITRWLGTLPRDLARSLIPPTIAPLARIFPVMCRDPLVANLSQHDTVSGDPAERRRDAFAAFAELLANLSARRQVVLWIDDLQWADKDSLEAMAQLVVIPNLAGATFVATERPAPDEPAHRRLDATEQRGRVRQIHLGALSPAEADGLLSAADYAPAVDSDQRRELLRESRGSPFVLLELARFAASGNARIQGVAAVLAARLDELSEQAREMFETLAVSGRPCSVETLTRAASASIMVLDRLDDAGLIRRAILSSGEFVEPIHDRFREAALDRLSLEVRQGIHRRLAVAIEAAESPDPETLADHWLAAGESARALPYVEAASDRAQSAFAFQRAASWFRRRVTLGETMGEPMEKLTPWRIREAEALVGMGHATKAAAIFERLAEGHTGEKRLDLIRRAAEQFLFAGRIDRGQTLYRAALAQTGIRWPNTSLGALMGLLWSRFRIRFGGLLDRGADIRHPTPKQALRIDLAYSVAMGLSVVDIARGAFVQAHHIRRALKWGDPLRVARGLAAEAGYRSTSGAVGRAQARALLDEAWAILGDDPPPEVRGFVRSMEAVLAWAGAEWRECALQSKAAVAVLSRRCRDRTYQLNLARSVLFDAAIWMGEFDSLVRDVDGLVEDARQRGDLYAETMFAMRFGCTAALAVDDVERARGWLSRLDGWSQTGFHTQHLVALHHTVDLALYTGDPHLALKEIQQSWPRARRALFFQSQPHRTKLRDLRARARLAVAAVEPPSTRSRLLRKVRQDLAGMRKERTRFARLLADLLELSARTIETGQLETARAQALVAASLQQNLGMHAHLLGSALGEVESVEWVRRQQVARPEHWLSIYYPGIRPHKLLLGAIRANVGENITPGT
ncbi:MAG: hypothetical protein ACI9OJ_005488, partial [Myxococcota bacterium]